MTEDAWRDADGDTEGAEGAADEDLDEQLLVALRTIPAGRKRQVLQYLRYVAGAGDWDPARVKSAGR